MHANRSEKLMEIDSYTLATLKRGQKGIIKSVDATDPQVQRLMVLGLVEGAEIEHASSAIGGDPMEFRLFGNGISLRQEQAKFFQVAPLEAGG
jgi:Fe2+ transport system protein FeoA